MADLQFFNLAAFREQALGRPLENPKAQELKKQVGEIEQIKNYLANRKYDMKF